jgi:hypothetical protein
MVVPLPEQVRYAAGTADALLKTAPVLETVLREKGCVET